MRNRLRQLKEWILCKMGDHEWTSMQREGIPPDKERIRAQPIEYFKQFSSMWCRRCGHDWGKEPWR